MVNILIVENDMTYCRKLINNIVSKNSNLRVVAIAGTVKETINIISKNNIDIILIDYKTIQNFENINLIINKKMIVLSNNSNFENLKVKYIILNKENFCEINKEINKMLVSMAYPNNINEINKEKIYSKIKQELNYLGYNPSYSGTKYIIEAIYIMYSLEDFYNVNLKKDIYPIIANKYQKNAHVIKCDITNATTAMYYDCEEKKLLEYLEEYSFHKQPGSKKIMVAILEKIKYGL